MMHGNWGADSADVGLSPTEIRIAELEAELEAKNKQYGELVKQLEDSANDWSTAYKILEAKLALAACAMPRVDTRV